MSRKPGLNLKHAYAVIAVPDSGLFVKNGEIVSGNGTSMRASELILFSRAQDAEQHAKQQVQYQIKAEDGWSFPVIPVLVSERL